MTSISALTEPAASWKPSSSTTATSQVELADAVADAREHGHTWAQIAAMVGTSRQAAQERYGEPAEHP